MFMAIKEVIGMNEHIQHGDVVCVISGRYRGRIGVYDNDNDAMTKAIVYFGNMFLSDEWHLIPHRQLRVANMVDLIQRHELILKQITPFNEPEKKANYDPQRRYFLLAEYCLVMDTMHERDKIARYEVADGSGKKIFISHSKKDKWLANTMAG